MIPGLLLLKFIGFGRATGDFFPSLVILLLLFLPSFLALIWAPDSISFRARQRTKRAERRRRALERGVGTERERERHVGCRTEKIKYIYIKEDVENEKEKGVQAGPLRVIAMCAAAASPFFSSESLISFVWIEERERERASTRQFFSLSP